MSQRSRTPPRSEFGRPPESNVYGATAPKEVIDVGKRQYHAHVFDLIFPLREVPTYAQLPHVPNSFLQTEAVDSSLGLGSGASFVASLQKVPKGLPEYQITNQSDDTTKTQTYKTPERPAHVVYKVARVAFDEKGYARPDYNISMRSVMTELHTLIHPLLIAHANIIKFLGVAFGSNPFSPAQRLPVIVQEYAQYGSLSEFLQREGLLTPETKHDFGLDVARGLKALHDVGLAHGDVKAENVLICAHSSRSYIAKVADFGFTVLTNQNDDMVTVGGTVPWKAPEANSPVPSHMLQRTDAFSFGLLQWLIAVDGLSPFTLILGSASPDQIEASKTSGILKRAALEGEWVRRWLELKYAPSPTEMDDIVQRTREHELFRDLSKILEHTLSASPTERDFDEVLAVLDPNIAQALKAATNAFHNQSDELRTVTVTNHGDTPQTLTHRRVDGSTSNGGADDGSTSHGSPDARATRVETVGKENKQWTTTITNHSTTDTKYYALPNMTMVPTESILYPEDNPAGAKAPLVVVPPGKSVVMTRIDPRLPPALDNTYIPAKDMQQIRSAWTQQGFNHRWLSWQKVRVLDPSIQNLVFSVFSGTDGPSQFKRASLLINGYGCPRDLTKGLETMTAAAELGFVEAAGYLHRIWQGCKVTPGFECGYNESPGAKYLERHAILGSRIAYEEYMRHEQVKETRDHTHRLITDAWAGIGADWLGNSQMLNGHTQSQWITDDWLLTQVQNAKSPPSDIIVNIRGDTVLHFVAMAGRLKPFKYLIEQMHVDINLRNSQGETPLLCATRAGQGGIMIHCLKKYGADASIAAQNGETPLHWLTQHDDAYIHLIAQDMLRNGAKIDVATRERVNHSVFNGGIDVEFQVPGTALSWAVHNNRPQIVRVLLGHGADPNWMRHADARLSPLCWAAYYHHHECLKIMIEHLEGTVTKRFADGTVDKRHATFFGNLVLPAIQAADKFSMMLRGGGEYLLRLRSTLDLLVEKTGGINFESQAMFEGSVLHYAISQGQDDVVAYMFEKQWLVDNVNVHCGLTQRTPLLEAVRWNRLHICELLISQGASVQSFAANPFKSDVVNWSALHVFAFEAHDEHLALVSYLVRRGVTVDGFTSAPTTWSPPDECDPSIEDMFTMMQIADKRSTPILPCETAFAVALRRNAFHLCTALCSLGGDPNALSLSAGLTACPYPLTVLGHIIVANARYSAVRLNYLFDMKDEPVAFVVEPARRLTALHRAAMAHRDAYAVNDGPIEASEFDLDTNADIMHELLLKWNEPVHLNATCGIRGNTALHLAVEMVNVDAASSLLRAGANPSILNEKDESASALAMRLEGATTRSGQIAGLFRGHEA